MNIEPSQFQMLLQKIRQFPVYTQQQTLELYILYVLRNDSIEDIKQFCQDLLSEETKNPGFINTVSLNDALNHEINNGEKIKQRIAKKLDHILDSYNISGLSEQDVYLKLENIDKSLNEIQLGLKNVVGSSKRYDNLSTTEMLTKIQQENRHHNDAMLDTLQIMFDRIFESINPDAAENYLDQSMLQVGPLKKAALFDASKEKYHQLLEYHQSGKFIRDYKVNYKRYLRNKTSD